MFKTLKLKTAGKKALHLLVSLMIVSSVAAGGVAAYDPSTNEGKYNVVIGEDTEAVFADVSSVVFNTEAGGTSNYTVTVTYTGMNSTDSTKNDVQIGTETITMTSGATVSSSLTLTEANLADYESVQVTVVVDNVDNSDLIDGDATVGTLEQITAGGGGSTDSGSSFLSGDIMGFPAVIVIGVIAVTGLVFLRD